MIALVVIFFFASTLVTFAADGVPTLDVAANVDGLSVAVGSVIGTVVGAFKRRRGRPRKFAVPSRAVTLTLPEAVLERLAAIDRDLSRAVVRLATKRAARDDDQPADLSIFGQRAVITVKPTPSLERRAGIDLVPLPNGRALISFDQPKTVSDLELILYDALDDRQLSPADRQVFEAIGNILKDARRSDDIKLLRKNIIVLESARRSRAKAPATKAVRTSETPRHRSNS